MTLSSAPKIQAILKRQRLENLHIAKQFLVENKNDPEYENACPVGPYVVIEQDKSKIIEDIISVFNKKIKVIMFKKHVPRSHGKSIKVQLINKPNIFKSS